MRRDQRGFTLPEVMIAGTLTLLLALPAMALLRTTYRLADQLQSRFAANAQAREVFTVLADGGSVASSAEVAASGAPASARGFALVESVRSHSSLPSCSTGLLQSTQGACLRNLYQLVFTDGALSLQGDLLAPISVTCTAAKVPIPACTGTETRSVQGWLGADPVITTASQASPLSTVDVNVTITNPFYATRASLAAAASEQYRTMFTLGVEANW